MKLVDRPHVLNVGLTISALDNEWLLSDKGCIKVSGAWRFSSRAGHLACLARCGHKEAELSGVN